MLFISAVNYYFDTLAAAASNYVLNPDHDNKAGIDVTAQRNAWIESGKAEVGGPVSYKHLEVGFVQGHHVFETAARDFEPQFQSIVRHHPVTFLDQM